MIIGIDPGKRGALVAEDGDYLLMPLQPDGRVDVGYVQDWLIRQAPECAYIERQQARGNQAGQGLVMENYGRLTAVLDLCGIPFVVLTPQVWQKEVGVGGDKQSHVQRASLLGFEVPMTSNRADAKPHDGVADAALICMAGKWISTTTVEASL